jgi:hypothetical protein
MRHGDMSTALRRIAHTASRLVPANTNGSKVVAEDLDPPVDSLNVPPARIPGDGGEPLDDLLADAEAIRTATARLSVSITCSGIW